MTDQTEERMGLLSALMDKVQIDCPDCTARIGDPHDAGCDVAICPTCGQQAMSHDAYDPRTRTYHVPAATYWTGFWPGVIECRERGWYVVGPPWVPVPPGTEGATEDLNRWSYFRQAGRDGLYDRQEST